MARKIVKRVVKTPSPKKAVKKVITKVIQKKVVAKVPAKRAAIKKKADRRKKSRPSKIPVDRTYKCMVCDYSGYHEKALEQHQKAKSHYLCQTCRVCFGTKEFLDKHLDNIHTFKCCQKKFYSKEAYEQHIQAMHVKRSRDMLDQLKLDYNKKWQSFDKDIRSLQIVHEKELKIKNQKLSECQTLLAEYQSQQFDDDDLLTAFDIVQIQIGDIQSLVQDQDRVTDVNQKKISQSLKQMIHVLTRTTQILKQSDPQLLNIGASRKKYLLRMSSIMVLDTQNNCSICHQFVQEATRSSPLKCGHNQFHTECIQTWFKEKQTCPLCRQNAV